MKQHQFRQLLTIIMLLLLAACSNETSAVSLPATPTPVRQATLTLRQSAPTPLQAESIVQQPLPKGLLNSDYPVMDWVFNIHCGQTITSYNSNQMKATIAYDSAAWLYPGDGHLVEGWQDCDKNALIERARNLGLSTLLTIGVDGSWSPQSLAEYIDQASSQPQEPCTPQATTYICAIVNWATSGGYKGVIIDFELVQGDYPGIQGKFATFMQKLQNALHQKGLLCGMTLLAKVSDNPAEDPYAKIDAFQNWQLLSRIDFLVDMELDFDVELNIPGPITSISWVDKQLNYLWQTMPQALSKTIFEFPFYGREWQQDVNGKWRHIGELTCQQVNDQKATQSLLSDVTSDSTTPEIAWNDQNGYRHEVWYNTTLSLITVITHLQEKVRGLLHVPHYKLPTSFWYRGAECPDFFGSGSALETFYNN